MTRPEPASAETPTPLIPDAGRVDELTRSARDWPSWDLTPTQLADLELLLNGAYAPLTGFMGRADSETCAAALRLADGTPFPVPITLGISDVCASKLTVGKNLV